MSTKPAYEARAESEAPVKQPMSAQQRGWLTRREHAALEELRVVSECERCPWERFIAVMAAYERGHAA